MFSGSEEGKRQTTCKFILSRLKKLYFLENPNTFFLQHFLTLIPILPKSSLFTFSCGDDESLTISDELLLNPHPILINVNSLPSL